MIKEFDSVLTPEAELDEAQWAMLGRLSKDLRAAADGLMTDEARYLVDTYYQVQKVRIATAGQVRSLADDHCRENLSKEDLDFMKDDLSDAGFRAWKEKQLVAADKAPFLIWMRDTLHTLEKSTCSALGRYAKQWAVGAWLQSLTGVGPILSAGLLAHVDIRKCATFGALWKFAGFDPTTKWEKKTKRPWNAALKSIVAFRLGECFVKVQNNPNDVYGKVYAARKVLETERNEKMMFRDQAEQALMEKKIGKDTEAYKAYSQGMLPKAHIHARARRVAVKLFLSHLHHMMFVDYYGKLPPNPYVIEFQEAHTHYIPPPNMDCAVGRPLKEMYGE